MKGQTFFPLVSKATYTYKSRISYPDTALVAARIASATTGSFLLELDMYSLKSARDALALERAHVDQQQADKGAPKGTGQGESKGLRKVASAQVTWTIVDVDSQRTGNLLDERHEEKWKVLHQHLMVQASGTQSPLATL